MMRKPARSLCDGGPRAGSAFVGGRPPGADAPLARTARALNEALINVGKTLFAHQVYVARESTAGVEFALAATLRSERARTA